MKKRIVILIVILIFLSSYLSFAYSFTKQADSLDALRNILIIDLYSRSPSIDIKYTGNSSGLEDLLDNIIDKDDYLKYTISNWKWNYIGYENDLDINLSASHLLTYSEENDSNIRIREILDNIISPEMSIHEQIKVVHDWIILNSQYDLTDNYRTQYNMLFQGKAVCQGYALLFDRMMKMLNIPCLFVIGDANGPHIWNLVRVDGFWYHIDLTFDDPVPDREGEASYDYFMLTEEEIDDDHTIEDTLLPISTVKYEDLLNSIGENQIMQAPIPFSINILALGKYVQYNDEYGFPFISNSRTLVPFRITLTSIGAEVYWEKETSTAIAKYNGITVRVPIGASYVLVDGKIIPNDSVSKIVEGRTYLPIRIVMESFGFNVNWDDKNQTVLINN